MRSRKKQDPDEITETTPGIKIDNTIQESEYLEGMPDLASLVPNYEEIVENVFSFDSCACSPSRKHEPDDVNLSDTPHAEKSKISESVRNCQDFIPSPNRTTSNESEHMFPERYTQKIDQNKCNENLYPMNENEKSDNIIDIENQQDVGCDTEIDSEIMSEMNASPKTLNTESLSQGKSYEAEIHECIGKMKEETKAKYDIAFDDQSNIEMKKKVEDSPIADSVYMIKVPSQFTFKLKRKKWKQIKVETNRFGKKLSRNWFQLFYAQFSKKVPECPLAAKYNHVKKDDSRKEGEPFFVGKAGCTIPGCGVMYKFTIDEIPGNHSKVYIHAKSVGEDDVCHKEGIQKSRPFQGKLRIEAKKRIQDIGPSNFFYERLGDADEKAILAGNYSGVGNKGVIQQMSAEMKSSEKFHYNMITELEILRDAFVSEDDSSKEVIGLIQYLSVYPFTVHLYSEEQILILCEILKKDPEKCLYFDATGSVVCKVPSQSKDVYYYPLLVKGNKQGDPPLAIAEMISNSHTIIDIYNFLSRIYRHCCILKPSVLPPTRVEVDFSWPMINAVLLAFNKESPLAYVSRASKIVQGELNSAKTLQRTVLHVCSAHFLHMIAGKLQRISKNKKVRSFILYCVACLLNSSTFQQFKLLFRAFAVVMLSPSTTSHTEYASCLKLIEQNLRREEISCDDFTAVSENEELEVEANKMKDTYFAVACRHIVEDLKKDLNTTKHGTDNFYFCAEGLNVVSQYTGTLPFWTGIMMGDLTRYQSDTCKDVELTVNCCFHETNSPAENWMKIVKTSVLQGKKRLRPAKFILKLNSNRKGRLREYRLSNTGSSDKILKGNKRKLRQTKENKEEKWKPKKKSKKGKYFKSKDPLTPSAKVDIKICPEEYDNVSAPTSTATQNKNCAATKSSVLTESMNSEISSEPQSASEGVLHWGGSFVTHGRTIYLANTCPVDNLLFMVYRVMLKNAACLSWLQENAEAIPVCQILVDIFDSFKAGEWQNGRRRWLEMCCQFSTKVSDWNVWGSETDRFVLPFSEIQETIAKSNCSLPDCPEPTSTWMSRKIFLG